MPNVTKKNLTIIKSIIAWKWNHLFTKNYFRKKKISYCYRFIPGDFQVICGSMVGETSAETTAWYNRTLRGPMTLRVHMFVQLWKRFLEELKSTRQKIIYTNRRLFMKKWYKVIKITIAKSTENVYHVARQNLILFTLPTIKTKTKYDS